MGLSPAFARKHISKWQSELHKNYYAWRRHWPTRLFHHSPLENAVAILKDGCLRSRNDPENQRARDVAAPGVIDNRNDAHDRVRLYFRPKNPTQWHIEGIRREGECRYGEDSHAPMLYMFSLDALEVLTSEDVWFSDKNMQIGHARYGAGEDFFDAIPFDKVYSEGGTGGDRSVTDARCAEVLPATPLNLDGCLKEIFCRSDPERDTLLFTLGNDAEKWAQYVLVSDNLKVFEKDFTFIEHASLSPDGFRFRMNPRRDYRDIDVRIRVRRVDGDVSVLTFSGPLRHKPENATNWIIAGELGPGSYLCEAKLEGHLAFSSVIALGDALL